MQLVQHIRHFVLAALLSAAAMAQAEPGDKLYVQASEVSVHVGPGSKQEVSMQLGRGHALIEFQRLGPGRHRVLGSDFKEVIFEISEEDGLWVNVGITDSDGKDGWLRAVDLGPSPLPGPVYDTDAYCEDVATVAGGSYVIEKGCLDLEAAARAEVEGTDVEPRIMEHCYEVATFAGGSYNVLKGCIEMEKQARAGLNGD